MYVLVPKMQIFVPKWYILVLWEGMYSDNFCNFFSESGMKAEWICELKRIYIL